MSKSRFPVSTRSQDQAPGRPCPSGHQRPARTANESGFRGPAFPRRATGPPSVGGRTRIYEATPSGERFATAPRGGCRNDNTRARPDSRRRVSRSAARRGAVAAEVLESGDVRNDRDRRRQEPGNDPAMVGLGIRLPGDCRRLADASIHGSSCLERGSRHHRRGSGREPEARRRVPETDARASAVAVDGQGLGDQPAPGGDPDRLPVADAAGARSAPRAAEPRRPARVDRFRRVHQEGNPRHDREARARALSATALSRRTTGPWRVSA